MKKYILLGAAVILVAGALIFTLSKPKLTFNYHYADYKLSITNSAEEVQEHSCTAGECSLRVKPDTYNIVISSDSHHNDEFEKVVKPFKSYSYRVKLDKIASLKSVEIFPGIQLDEQYEDVTLNLDEASLNLVDADAAMTIPFVDDAISQISVSRDGQYALLMGQSRAHLYSASSDSIIEEFAGVEPSYGIAWENDSSHLFFISISNEQKGVLNRYNFETKEKKTLALVSDIQNQGELLNPYRGDIMTIVSGDKAYRILKTKRSTLTALENTSIVSPYISHAGGQLIYTNGNGQSTYKDLRAQQNDPVALPFTVSVDQTLWNDKAALYVLATSGDQLDSEIFTQAHAYIDENGLSDNQVLVVEYDPTMLKEVMIHGMIDLNQYDDIESLELVRPEGNTKAYLRSTVENKFYELDLGIE